MRVDWRFSLPFAAFVAAALITACGGSGEPTFGFEEASATPTRDESSGAPPAAPVEPTATPDPVLRFEPGEPIFPQDPPTGVDLILGGAPDRQAARAITDELKTDGFVVPGLAFFVFPLPDGAGSMLVINFDIPVEAVDESPEGSVLATLDQDGLLRSLVAGQAYQDAHVTRLVLNLRFVTADGTLIFTATLPGHVFVDSVNGTITQEEADAQTISEIRWVDAQ